jgi:hypothetical protein
MNRDDVTRMAREAQMPFYWRTGEITYLDKLEAFAALVASAEREMCAGLRKEIELQGKHPTDYEEGFWDGLEKYENLIRARGKA